MTGAREERPVLQKLRRQTLAEQAAQSLTEFIRARDLKPGDVLESEAKLAAELGVSRPVIREALKALHGRGIIETVTGKRTIIRPIDNDLLRLFFQRAVEIERGAIVELLEVRQGLEIRSATLAARRRTPEDLAAMAAIVAAMRRHLQDGDTYVDLDLELHLLIARATRNTMLYHLMESLRGALQDTMREIHRCWEIQQQLERVQAMHEDLLAELKRGDAEGAARAMALQLDEAVTVLSIPDPAPVPPDAMPPDPAGSPASHP
jgi:GntR family transcriptional repressor for pyruvate dehydrogenase complex